MKVLKFKIKIKKWFYKKLTSRYLHTFDLRTFDFLNQNVVENYNKKSKKINIIKLLKNYLQKSIRNIFLMLLNTIYIIKNLMLKDLEIIYGGNY